MLGLVLGLGYGNLSSFSVYSLPPPPIGIFVFMAFFLLWEFILKTQNFCNGYEKSGTLRAINALMR